MDARLRGVIFVLSVLTVAVVGALGVSAIRAPERPHWPDRIAVIGLDDDARQPVRFLAIADPVRRAVVVVPVESVVEVPGSGFLRAYHAHRLGDSPLVRDTLGRLFGVTVPFSVIGSGGSLESVVQTFTLAEIPEEHLTDLTSALEEGVGTWEIYEVEGERRTGPGGMYLVVDPTSVRAAAGAIGGLGTRVFVDPAGEVDLAETEPVEDHPVTPVPEAPDAPEAIDPPEISIEVLNGSSISGAASRAADRLEDLGYRIVRIADFRTSDRTESLVYFRPDDEQGEAMARQVADELGYRAEPLPDGISMREATDVLIVLGEDTES